jgi:hypothetical protein
MLPTEAENQQAQFLKLTPQNFPKATHAVLVLEAQLEIDNKVLMEQCRLYRQTLSGNKLKFIFII